MVMFEFLGYFLAAKQSFAFLSARREMITRLSELKAFVTLLRMRSSLISDPTEHFSKLIYVKEILFHRPYESCGNSNTDIEELFS